MFTINYTVTDNSGSEFTAYVMIGDQLTPVQVQGLVVDMTSDDHSMGHTFRSVPADIEATRAEFTIGTQVVVTFTPGPAAPPPPPPPPPPPEEEV